MARQGFKEIRETLQPAKNQASFGREGKVFCLGGSNNGSLDKVVLFNEVNNDWTLSQFRLPKASAGIAGQEIERKGCVLWSHYSYGFENTYLFDSDGFTRHAQKCPSSSNRFVHWKPVTHAEGIFWFDYDLKFLRYDLKNSTWEGLHIWLLQTLL